MKFSVHLPLDHIQYGDEFVGQQAVTEIAQAAEDGGLDAGYVTDHPCPTGRWLDAGGHFAQDPFVMLAGIAAVTKRIKLQTGLIVLPYRNPFIVARAVASLDVYSGGRVILGAGAGYLKGEYKALGVDFESRNDDMDEIIQAMKTAWSQDEFSFKGKNYEARACRILPRPIQQPGPPIWIGGNSNRAIRRAVELCEGWMPMEASPLLAATARTKAMESENELHERLQYMHEHIKKTGRTAPLDLAMNLSTPVTDHGAFREEVARYAALGFNWMAIIIPGETRKAWCANVRRFGTEIIAKKAA